MSTVSPTPVRMAFLFTANDRVGIARPCSVTLPDQFTLTADEWLLLRHLAELSMDGGGEMASGAMYTAVKEQMPMSYTLFYERVRNADDLRLIEVHRRPGPGSKREIVMR